MVQRKILGPVFYIQLFLDFVIAIKENRYITRPVERQLFFRSTPRTPMPYCKNEFYGMYMPTFDIQGWGDIH
jgi:hypothetical protein